MRRERDGDRGGSEGSRDGGGRSEGGSSNRGGRGRGGRGGRGGGGGGGNRRGGRRNGRSGREFFRQSAESGNQRERIAVESGTLVLIDQFMLANPQFIEKLALLADEEPSKKNEVIGEYGGLVVDVEPGTYRIARDPFACSIIIHPDGVEPQVDTLLETASDDKGHLFIDTRCVAMIDRELLDDASLLEKYQQLWFGGQDKACRDLLRDNGGAVRYGFQRNGDDLGVFVVPTDDIVCLWPSGLKGGVPKDQQHAQSIESAA